MEPLIAREAFDATTFNDALFLETFASMRQLKPSALRFYADGCLSPKHAQALLNEYPKSGESLQDWLKRSLNCEKFGVVINGVEKISDRLGRWASSLLDPIVKILGPQQTFLEIIIFAGNYGYTPFGIHIDDPYSSVLHFHVGPGRKTMTMFTREQFRELHPSSDTCFEPERLAPNGQPYEMATGDVFLQPPHYYHIGFTPDFSLDVTVGVSKMTPSKITRFILSRAIGAEWMDADLPDLLSRARSYGNGETTLEEWIRRNAEEYEASSLSSGRLRNNYLCRHDVSLTSETVVRLDSAFSLSVLSRKDELLVFVRGNAIRLKATVHLERLLSVLIEKRVVTANELHNAVSGKISVPAIIKLLSTIARFGGLGASLPV